MKSNQTMNICLLTGLVMAIALTTGCASGPTRVEEDFGNSVRAMRQQQVMDPVAAATVDTTPVTSTDGQRMESVLESYRQSVGEPKEVSKPIKFEISE